MQSPLALQGVQWLSSWAAWGLSQDVGAFLPFAKPMIAAQAKAMAAEKCHNQAQPATAAAILQAHALYPASDSGKTLP